MRGSLWAIILSVASTAFLPAPASADESNFLVLPVTTDLQRSAWNGHPRACAYVLVNGTALLQGDATIRWQALDFDALAKALMPLRRDKDAVVIFVVIHDALRQPDAGRLIRWALIGFAREKSFADVRVVENVRGGFDWQKHIVAMNEKIGAQPDGDEPAAKDGSVVVHPVRTVLSRYLFEGADCVVTLTTPFPKGSDGKLPPEMEAAIRRRVGALKLPHKRAVLFRVGYKQGGRDAVERFYETVARELAEALGFKDRSMMSRFEP
jgi:hypothetical protein